MAVDNRMLGGLVVGQNVELIQRGEIRVDVDLAALVANGQIQGFVEADRLAIDLHRQGIREGFAGDR